MKFYSYLFSGILARSADPYVSECMNGRTCVRNIPNCSPMKDANCALVAYNVADDKLNVTMIHSGANTWTAVGFGPSTSMWSSDITYCQNGSSGIKLVSSYSYGNGRPSDISGLEGYYNLETPKSGNVYGCSFQKDLKVQKKGRTIDLANNDYHVLLAKGQMSGDRPSYHGYGTQNRLATKQKLSFKP